jgi:starch-binding outer membrane protein, SusD/RagB family
MKRITEMKYFGALALLFTAVTVSACDDEFLTEVPSDFVAPENFYRNADDALAAVNAAYATFINLRSPLSNDDYYGRNFFMVTEFQTETITNRLSATNERSLVDNFHTQFLSTHPYIETIWQAAYAGINRANSVIDRVPSVPMDAEMRDRIVAEGKFLRALHYYNLAGLFGGVPLKLSETVGLQDLTLPRATASETWEQIITDLEEAAAVLPESYPASELGRATKGAALTLLGKAHLQRAQTGAGSAADFAAAEAAFREVMTLGYSLDPNYASLFDGSNEESPEIIFSIQNAPVPGFGGRLSEWIAPNPTSGTVVFPGALNHFQAERPFYDSYNPTDSRKAGTWLVSYIQSDTVLVWDWTKGNAMRDQYGSTGPTLVKYLDSDASDEGAEEPDIVLLRYADVLLSLAEAINEQAGPTGEAYLLIDDVRDRAGVPGLTTGLSQDQFRDSLFLERRFEFTGETHGIFDSRRNWPWAKARIEAHMAQRSALNRTPFTSSVPKFDARPIPDKWRLMPIPNRACQLNDLLTQNPGWDVGECEGTAP